MEKNGKGATSTEASQSRRNLVPVLGGEWNDKIRPYHPARVEILNHEGISTPRVFHFLVCLEVWSSSLDFLGISNCKPSSFLDKLWLEHSGYSFAHSWQILHMHLDIWSTKRI